MASQPQPGSTHGKPRGPPPASPSLTASVWAAPPCSSYVQTCVELFDWWLERVEGEEGKIRVAGFTTRNRAARVFTSNSITTRHADGTLETADGVIVLIKGPLNVSRMHQNGFPHEVSKWFQLGFPVEWEKCANSNMKQTNEHARSPLKSTSASSLSGSTEYYIEKFLRGSFINSMGYAFTGNDFNSSKRSTSNTDRPPIQRLSNLSNGTAKFQESTGNNDTLMSKLPKEPFAAPGGTCNSGQAGQEDNQHESVHKYASGQKMDTHSVDSALINNHMDHISSDLEECGTPKCGKTLVHLGTEDALEVPTKGMSPQFGVSRGSEDNTIRRLRNGKVFGMSSGASLKKQGYKRKRMQNETFNKKMVPNEEITPPATLTSHKNVRSPLTHSKAKVLSVSTPEYPKLRSTRTGRLIVPRLDPGSQNIIYDMDRRTGTLLGTGPRHRDSQRLWELDWLHLPFVVSTSQSAATSPFGLAASSTTSFV